MTDFVEEYVRLLGMLLDAPIIWAAIVMIVGALTFAASSRDDNQE